MKKALKKALFIDRDGTLIVEPPVDMQVDSLAKLEFVPGAISALKVLRGLDFELVMATNQDGLGTDSFPEEDSGFRRRRCSARWRAKACCSTTC